MRSIYNHMGAIQDYYSQPTTEYKPPPNWGAYDPSQPITGPDTTLNPPGSSPLLDGQGNVLYQPTGLFSTGTAPPPPSAPQTPDVIAPPRSYAPPTVNDAPRSYAPPTVADAPRAYGVPEAQQSVASHLEGILAKDSPLMQRAQTQGMQYANSRGLLNSTMAAGASQGAMIDRAMPIAQQDAGHYQNMQQIGYGADLNLQRDQYGQVNALQQQGYGADLNLQRDQYGQVNNLQNMGYGADLSLQSQGYGAQTDMQKMGYGAQVDMTKMGYAAEVDLNMLRQAAGIDLQKMEWASRLDTESKSRLMEEEAGWSQLLKANDHAADAWRQGMNSITMIQADPNMTPEQKMAGTNAILDWMRDQRAFLGDLYGVPMPDSNFTPISGFPGSPDAPGSTTGSQVLTDFLAAHPEIEQAYYRESSATRANETLAQYAYRYAMVHNLNPPPELRP